MDKVRCEAKQDETGSISYQLKTETNMLSLKDSVDKAVALLEFIAPLTAVTVDDELLEAAKAVQASPALLTYLQSKMDAKGNIPEGVLTSEDVPEGVRQDLKFDGSRIKKLVELMPQIIALVNMIRGMFPTTPATPA